MTENTNNSKEKNRTGNKKKNHFASLGLPDCALKAIKRLGYEEPTPVQSTAIPAVIAGRDVIAAAATGTGKTAAFLLPTLSKLKPSKKAGRAPRVLVISPTRELIEQISKVSFAICKSCGLFSVCVFGGQPYGPQIKDLRRGCDILLATPGRLCDLMDKGAVDLSHIEVLVLDEADRMLNMGFLPDVRKIVEKTPVTRQTLLFSATIDAGIKHNFEALLKDPEVIQIASRGETAKLVDQYILPVPQKDKAELLKCLLDEKGYDKVIVFARTRSRADAVSKSLKEAGFDVECIHSNKTQGQRKAALSNFRKGVSNIIVATDVLARGIDVPSVEYVVNYDLPDMAEDYIHRIGRTGRAGEAGYAVSFVSPNSMKTLDAIERLLGKEIPVMRISSYDVDMSILRKPGKPKKHGSSRPGKRKKKPSKSSNAAYNYEGWGDLRKGKKKKSADKRDINAKRPGYKSSGLAKRNRKKN